MADVCVWLPEPIEVYDDLPAGLSIDFYDGVVEPPASVDDVELYVPPYLGGGQTLEVIRRMSKLRVLQLQTAGFENVLPYVRDGVTLCNARGVHDASTAELAVALILGSLRGMADFVRGQDAHQWVHGRRESVADKTVLIVGYGSIGAALERRLLPFECEVLRVARTARPEQDIVAVSDLPELLPRADVVVILLPSTNETRGLVDEKFLGRMKDGALFVNVARGDIVHTQALVAELSTGRLRAGLDVTDPEPLPAGHPLWDVPGLVLSPHVGGNTDAFVPRSRRLVVEQLRRFVAGEPLANVITGAY